MEMVKFNTLSGDEVSFDENGDVLPFYDVINWAWRPDGSIKLRTVGVYKMSASAGEELILDEDSILWNFESAQVTFAFYNG